MAGSGKEKREGRSSENKLVVLHLTCDQRNSCRFWVLLGQQESVCLCLLVKRTAKGYVRTVAQFLTVSGAHLLTLKWSLRVDFCVRIGVRPATVSPLEKVAVFALNN